VTSDVLTLEGLRRRRAEILGVARKRRARRIAVFGSVARGEAQPDSDVDLLVDFEPGASPWDTERPLRLAGEAVTGRLDDIATKLPDEIIKATPEIPWRESRA
jgi:uncharacterized protein